MALFSEVFPEFDPATLPAIPDEWTDSSYRNEPSPSWTFGRFQIFVDFADPELREFPEIDTRFSVVDVESFDNELSTNEWEAILAFVKANA